MKKTLCVLLAVVLVLILAAPALAAGEYTFSLSANGSSSATVEVGEKVTVVLTIEKSDGADFTLYSMQDYILFDPSYFSIDTATIAVKKDSSSGREVSVFQASALRFDADEYNRVFVNRPSTSGLEMPASVEVVSFELTALREGTTSLSHDAIEMLAPNLSAYSVTEAPANVTITAAGGDEPPTPPIPTPTPTPTPPGGGGGGGVTPPTTPTPPPVTPPAPAPWVNPFTDVKSADWFYDAVAYCCSNGLMKGVGGSEFNPGGIVSRAEVWQVLANLAGARSNTAKTPWYTDAQAWAMGAGVSDGTNPTGTVTREQLVTMLYRYYTLIAKGTFAGGMSAKEFDDYEAVSDWAELAVQWGVSDGIIQGSAGRLNPSGGASRAELATMLMRFDKLLK